MTLRTLAFTLLSLSVLHAAAQDRDPRCASEQAEYPARDRAGAQAFAASCDAMAFYYGLGTAVDDAKARQCAFAAGDSGVLMMLYANGRGVERDFALARRAACDFGGAPAELSGRLHHLAEMEAAVRSSGGSTRPIDLCDDITSGRMMGVCTWIASRQGAGKREAEITRLTASWTAAQKAAWVRLREKAAAFIAAHGDGEVDLSGTARAALVIDAQDGLRAQFMELLREAESGRFAADNGPLNPQLAQQARDLDRQLNAVYGELRATRDGEGTTTATLEDIRKAQRAWLGYRDAWVAFGHVRYPAVPADAWRARLTAQRVDMLRELLDARRP